MEFAYKTLAHKGKNKMFPVTLYAFFNAGNCQSGLT